MKTLNLRTATLDDIVFEGRNQAYGAFVLRRIYNRHLASALAVAVTLFLALVAFPVAWNRLFPTMTIVPPLEDILPPPTIVVLPPTVVPDQPVAVQPAIRQATKPLRADIATKVVDDHLVKPADKPVEVMLTDKLEPGLEPGPVGSATSVGPATGALAGGLDSGHTAPAAAPAPFIHAEIMPEFAGGQAALVRYLQRNLRYPRQALAAAVSGRVFVSFTVNTDGSITDVEVLKGLGYGTDEEAARVIGQMPAWTPGRQNSHPVAVRYTLPSTFHYE